MEFKHQNLDYSLKCIPVPNKVTHIRGIINRTEQFLQRLRWKVHFFFNPSDKTKETYGFNSTRNAPQHKTLVNFEEDLTHLISNLEYSDKMTPFQKRLLNDAKNIKKSDKVYVTADKTRNVYQLDKDSYNKLMRDNVTSKYEKASGDTEFKINSKAKSITEKLDISDRVEPIAHKNAYLTVKDHKDNFPNNVKCRLINPAKSNVGKISKQILQQINDKLRTELKLQQWRSTNDTLNWFKALENKTRRKFIQLDIVDFYPSISQNLFDAAIEFAKNTVPITTQTIDILQHARQTILFHSDATWKKTTGLFDVSMGSYDGCEVCELVGLYIIDTLKQKHPEIDFGLYRDDGLGTLKRTPKTKLEKLKKRTTQHFQRAGACNHM